MNDWFLQANRLVDAGSARRGVFAAVAAAALSFNPGAGRAAETTRYRTEIRTPSGDKKLYDGETVQTLDAGLTKRRTWFRRGADVVASSEVVFRSDTLRLESYAQDDFVCGQRARIQREGDTLVLRFADKPGAAEDVTRFDDSAGKLSAGSLAMDTILRQWADMEAGREARFEMIVSEKGFHVPFISGAPERVKAMGRDAVRVRVKTSNWLLRIFAPEVVFTFAAAAPHEPLEVFAPTIVRDSSCDLVRGTTILERL